MGFLLTGGKWFIGFSIAGFICGRKNRKYRINLQAKIQINIENTGHHNY
jgi:hypothetical protein